MSHRLGTPKSRSLLVLGVMLCAALAVPAQALAGSASDGYGIYAVQVESAGVWTTVGSASFGTQYETQSVPLPGVYSRVRLVQSGGTAAQLDMVELGGVAPIAASGSPDPLVLAKLLAADNDVTNVHDSAVVVVFPGAGARVDIRARVQGDLSGAFPFEFPVENTCGPVTTGSAFYSADTGSLPTTIDTEDMPFAKVLSKPGTGHPEGYTYLWIADDGENLRVVMDFTPDNTVDANDDYATVHVNSVAGVRDFRVSELEKAWGDVAFTYTDKVSYQHKLYSFAIPWSAVGGRTQTVELAFTAYGTAAYIPVPLPVYRFFRASRGTHFYTATEAEKASVIAHPEWGYVYEGIAYIVDASHPANRFPLYRFYNARTGVHFYTASETEKANVAAHPEWGYVYEGVAYNVASPAEGIAPIYRFYNRIGGTHFYTASEAEKNAVESTLGGTFNFEGAAFYIWPVLANPT